jgi:hypothetical protein
MKKILSSSVMKNILKYLTLIGAFAICIINHEDKHFTAFTHRELQGLEFVLVGTFVCTFLWVTLTTYKDQSQGVKAFLILGMSCITFFMLPTTGNSEMFIARIVIYCFTAIVFMFLDLVILLSKIPKIQPSQP